jgi:hypothetical protein
MVGQTAVSPVQACCWMKSNVEHAALRVCSEGGKE